ncbi:cytochrome P450 monooxygenase [Apiospora rasikravindrae]|uniref:Cytochrome P450 monooxygenase n=1 Tax=Apiospora rasikravindrae TaxID=990691 RepID=A0ABR1T0P5_9PEZI
MLSQVLFSVALAYIGWSFACLEANVRKARSLGVPVLRLPIDVNNVFWILLQPHIWKVLDSLPFQWSSYPRVVRYLRRGWYMHAKAEAHELLGPVWALAAPVTFVIHVADPDAIQHILNRPGDFQRPYEEMQLLELYGPCLSTVPWEDWARHRKPMASPFNESIMASVWHESIRQAGGLLRSWTTHSQSGIPSYQQDTKTFALNVLSSTGFGSPYDFRGSTEPADGDMGGYRNSLKTVLDNIILLMLVPYHILAKLPGRYAEIGNAAADFKRNMVKLLDDTTTALKTGKPGSGLIMSSFVRAAELYHRDHPLGTAVEDDAKPAKRGLSANEILGDLFCINIAGYDTAANTMAFAVLCMAAHPEVQTWVAEEVDLVTRAYASREDWDYKALFPQLKRCRAVMHETLRLFPLFPHCHTLPVDGSRTIAVPMGTKFAANTRAMQTHPKYWPDDPEQWRPSRWIANPAPAGLPPTDELLAREELLVQRKSVFFPWGDGPQSCPGKKFSEVEVTAMTACLFKAHRLSIKRKYEGESDKAVYKRFEKCIADLDLIMLVRLRDGDQVTLVCTEA